MTDTRRAPLDVSFWPLQIGGWLAFAAAMTASRIGRFPFAYMVATKSLIALIGAVLTALILRPIYRRLLAKDPSLMPLLAVVIPASYVVGVLWTAADGALDIPVQQWLLDPRAHLTNAWQLFGGTLYDAFAILAWSVLYVAIKHQQALAREQARALQAEAMAHRARLDALRWQLNPHFLFNSLNAISTLVVDGRADDAGKMIARLADFLRTTVSPHDTGFVSVAEEMEAVRSYLDIEKVRLGDRLRLSIDVTDDAWQARLPSLLLQPLVENAVRHAVAVREDGGEIRVAARRVNERLQLIVDDDGPGDATPARNGGGSRQIGLANTRARLLHGYGDAHTLALERNDHGGTRLRRAAVLRRGAMRALIVDDEALARRGIRVRLERLGGVEVVGDCDSGRTAIAAIHALSPDVVFLDVQMPGLDGFDVVDQVGASNMPVTIFVTAYDSHAIRAFDAQALDYLLKPIDDDRFARAVNRVRAHLSERGAATRASKLAAIIDELHAGPRIVVRDRGSVTFIELGDVDWIAAEGDYVRIFAGSRSHLQRATMDAVEAQLDSERFVRVHRSAIVNVDRVREVRPRGGRDHIVVLRGGARVRVSRAGHDRLAALIARK